MQIYEIETDESLQSKINYGTIEFPFEYYYDEIEKFKEQCITWHWHPEFEFSLVVSGTVACLIGSERIILHSGAGLFINSGVIHRFESVKQGSLKNIFFSPKFLAADTTRIYKNYIAPFLNSCLKYHAFHCSEPSEAVCIERIHYIYDCAEQKQNLWELRLQENVNLLWQNVFQMLAPELSVETTRYSKLLQARVQRMLYYIHGHYQEKITLNDIAAAANISKSEALRCFRLSVQSTPIRYMNEYRLRCAEALLCCTNTTVSSIALDVGFENAGYFCQVFKAKYGITPVDYRKIHFK